MMKSEIADLHFSSHICMCLEEGLSYWSKVYSQKNNVNWDSQTIYLICLSDQNYLDGGHKGFFVVLWPSWWWPAHTL